jgi:glycosyltransferase involved in cell wall biosynthesis
MLTRLAILIPEFPNQTHAFFWREIQAIEALGFKVFIVSTTTPPIENCPHAFAKEVASRTTYCWPPNFYEILHAAIISALRLPKAIRFILSLKKQTFFQKLKLLVAALQLRGYMQTNNVTHVHVHSFARSALLIRVVKELGGPNYSLCLHGDLEVYGEDHDKKVAQAQCLIAVTRPLREEIVQELDFNPEKVLINSMGVDVSKFNVIDHSRPPSGIVKLITVARINRTKGHTYALQAIEILKQKGIEIEYKVIGTGKPAAIETLKNEIHQRSLEDNVHLLGVQSETAVAQALQDADIFLLTSIEKGEAAPVSVMEAMASGLPTVVSIIGGTADMVDSGKNGILVEQKNVEQIISAIEKYHRDREYWIIIGKNARAHAESEFDFNIRARRTLEFIESHS